MTEEEEDRAIAEVDVVMAECREAERVEAERVDGYIKGIHEEFDADPFCVGVIALNGAADQAGVTWLRREDDDAFLRKVFTDPQWDIWVVYIEPRGLPIENERGEREFRWFSNRVLTDEQRDFMLGYLWDDQAKIRAVD